MTAASLEPGAHAPPGRRRSRSRDRRCFAGGGWRCCPRMRNSPRGHRPEWRGQVDAAQGRARHRGEGRRRGALPGPRTGAGGGSLSARRALRRRRRGDRARHPRRDHGSARRGSRRNSGAPRPRHRARLFRPCAGDNCPRRGRGAGRARLHRRCSAGGLWRASFGRASGAGGRELGIWRRSSPRSPCPWATTPRPWRLGRGCSASRRGRAAAFWCSTGARGSPMQWPMPLPGIALGFLAMAALGGEGRMLPGLLAGAAATARLIRNRLAGQVWWSVGLAALSAVLGCVLAGYGPLRLGAAHALSVAGMIATVSGLMLAPRLPDRPAPASGGAGPAACG